MANAIRKRIALAAAVAVSAGLLGAVPAQAAVAGSTAATPFVVTTAEYVADEAGTAIALAERDLSASSDSKTSDVLNVQHPAGAGNYIELTAASDLDSATYSGVRVDVTGSTISYAKESADVETSGNTDTATVNAAATSVVFDSGTVANSTTLTSGAKVRVLTPSVGTVTIKVYGTSISNGVTTSKLLQTVNVTVNAEAVAGVAVASKSTSIISADASYGVTDEKLSVSAAVSANRAASIKVTLKDANGGVVTGKKLTASISGPGTLAIGDVSEPSSATGRSITSETLADEVAFIGVFADGTSGVSTITISVGTTVIATETLTFFGKAAKIVATVLEPHISAAATSTGVAEAVLVTVTDANGVVVVNDTPTATYVGTSASVSAGAREVDNTLYYTALSKGATEKGKTTVTLKSSTNTDLTASFDLVVTKSVITTLDFAADKATYAPGEKITLTLTAKDADGVLMGAYNDKVTVFEDTMTASVAVQGSLFGEQLNFSAGVAKVTVYAPLGAGPVTFSAATSKTNTTELALALLNVTKSVTVNVSGSPEISQIKADLAALQKSTSDLIAALSAQVSYLRKQLNQLLRRR